MSTRPRASSARLRAVADGDEDPLTPEQRKELEAQMRRLRSLAVRDELMEVITLAKPLPETQAEQDRFIRDSMILSMYVLRLDLMRRGGTMAPHHRRRAAEAILRSGEKLLGLSGPGAMRRARGQLPTPAPSPETPPGSAMTAAQRIMAEARGRQFVPEDPPPDGA